MATSVKIVKLPGRVEEFLLEDGATVEDGLEQAGITLESNSEIKVNGNISNKGTVLRNGDSVVVSTKIKGNATSVKIVKLPGRVEEFLLEDGATVEDGLDQAGITLESNSEIKVNGNISNKGTVLRNGDSVVVSTKIKGN